MKPQLFLIMAAASLLSGLAMASETSKTIVLARPFSFTNGKTTAADDKAFRPETDPNKLETNTYKAVSGNTKKAGIGMMEANQQVNNQSANNSNVLKYVEQYRNNNAVH